MSMRWNQRPLTCVTSTIDFEPSPAVISTLTTSVWIAIVVGSCLPATETVIADQAAGFDRSSLSLLRLMFTDKTVASSEQPNNTGVRKVPKYARRRSFMGGDTRYSPPPRSTGLVEFPELE